MMNGYLFNSINNNNSIKTTLLIMKEKNIRLYLCSEIYISTQTKIAYLNSEIDLYNIFWNLPVLNYYSPEDGIIN